MPDTSQHYPSVFSQQPKSDYLSSYILGLTTLGKVIFNDSFMTRRRIQSLQERRLRLLVEHAYQNVPFYKDLMDERGVHPSEIRRISDLGQLPIIHKKDILEEDPARVVDQSIRIDKLKTMTTSGTTGKPLVVPWSNRTFVNFFAASFRAHRAWNCKLTDKIVCVGPRYYPANLFVQKFGIVPVRLVSPFLEPREICRSLKEERPEVLLTYPSVLKCLNHYFEISGDTPYRPRLIMTSGEYLEEEVASTTEKVFGSRPYQLYGSWEIGRIAHECRYRTGFHINEDFLIAEFLPFEDHPEPGCYRLVMTNLFNFAMPFIRYAQGDIVTKEEGPCPCGSCFQRIRIKEGRTSATIELPDGRRISALRLTTPVLAIPELEQFKFIQQSRDLMILQIIVKKDVSTSAIDEMLGLIRSNLDAMQLQLQVVDRIDPDPSGKTHPFEIRTARD